MPKKTKSKDHTAQQRVESLKKRAAAEKEPRAADDIASLRKRVRAMDEKYKNTTLADKARSAMRQAEANARINDLRKIALAAKQRQRNTAAERPPGGAPRAAAVGTLLRSLIDHVKATRASNTLAQAEEDESKRRAALVKEGAEHGPLVHPQHEQFGVTETRAKNGNGYMTEQVPARGNNFTAAKVPETAVAGRAPTSLANRRTIGQPTITTHVDRDYLGADGVARKTLWTVVEHEEYVQDLIPNGAAYTNGSIQINPAAATTYPFLSQFSQNFEQYSFHEHQTEHVTQSSTGTTGRQGGVYDYVVTDAAPTSKNVFYGTNGFVATAMWENMAVAMRKVPADYINTFFIGPVPAGADPKFYAPANYFWFVKDSTVSTTVAEAMVRYKVWLLEPTLENASSTANNVAHYVASSGAAVGWTLAGGSNAIATVTGSPTATVMYLPNVTATYYVSGSMGNATAAETKSVTFALTTVNAATTPQFIAGGQSITWAEVGASSSNAANASTINTTAVNGNTTALNGGGLGGVQLLFSGHISVTQQAPTNPANAVMPTVAIANGNTTYGPTPAWLFVVKLPSGFTAKAPASDRKDEKKAATDIAHTSNQQPPVGAPPHAPPMSAMPIGAAAQPTATPRPPALRLDHF